MPSAAQRESRLKAKQAQGAEDEGADGEGASRQQHGSGDQDYDLPSSSLLRFGGQLLVTAGRHFFVYDLKNPATATFSSASSDDAHKSGVIRDVGVCADGKYLVSGGDDKQMKVWRTDTWKLHQSCTLSKKATAVVITDDGKYVAGADKFGEVVSMEIGDEPSGQAEGQFCLGHMSIVTCMAVLPGGNVVVTGDRDSAVRTSCFPDGFNIESFCLGHSTWVAKVALPKGHDGLLFSVDGAAELILWNHTTGDLLDKQSLVAAADEACAPTAIAYDSETQLLAVALAKSVVFVKLDAAKQCFTQVGKFTAEHAVSSLCFDNETKCLWASFCALTSEGIATPHIAAFNNPTADGVFSAVPESHTAHGICASVSAAAASNIEGLAQVAGVTQRQWVERPSSGPTATAKRQKTE